MERRVAEETARRQMLDDTQNGMAGDESWKLLSQVW
jgi:hypothetical protein